VRQPGQRQVMHLKRTALTNRRVSALAELKK